VSDFEGQIWTAQDNDDVNFVCITKRIKKKIQAINNKGRELRLSEDKLLWQHPKTLQHQDEWNSTLNSIEDMVGSLRGNVDVELLWETASELAVSDIEELADLYFGDTTIEHLAAIWRALAEDRLHFKRKAQIWEPRTAEQIKELKLQRERQAKREYEEKIATEWINKAARQDKVEVTEEIAFFITRLDAWLLRGDSDKFVSELVRQVAESLKAAPREIAFEVLQKIGHLPSNADRDVIVGGLKPDFPQAVNELATTIQPWFPEDTQNVINLSYSIDDEETREVDDALKLEKTENGWKILIGIADPECVVHRGDLLDKEAMRRGTTVYLPTQTVLMLPERISCNIASLTANHVHSSIVVSVWLDEQGEITNSSIQREAIKVEQRLHYEDADQLINDGQNETAQSLKDLLTIAQQLQRKRVAAGAFNLQRSEYKIDVKGDEIKVELLERYSASRMLVAEMMILANHVAAKYAQQHEVPIIYRTQEPPIEPITMDMTTEPLAFQKLRKFLKASTLSLHPSEHSGLGLSVYTQLTSPLRRFADLVIQRQLAAHVMGEELPYNQDELLKVLETAERTAREARKLENDAKRRWFIKYLQQSWLNKSLEALVVEEAKAGYKVEIQPWGVEAYLAANRSIELGETVTTKIDKLRERIGNIRLKLSYN